MSGGSGGGAGSLRTVRDAASLVGVATKMRGKTDWWIIHKGCLALCIEGMAHIANNFFPLETGLVPLKRTRRP